MAAPEPTSISKARQFWTPNGSEIFYAEAYGRRPLVTDSLRAMGWGIDRESATESARKNWKAAWRSLATKSRVAQDQTSA